MILMATLNFAGGLETLNAALFCYAPPAENYEIAGAIQKPADLIGTVATDPDCKLYGVEAVTDLLAADPACSANVTPDWVAGAPVSIDVEWDGVAAPPGDASVVRGVWKGVDVLIFLNFPVV